MKDYKTGIPERFWKLYLAMKVEEVNILSKFLETLLSAGSCVTFGKVIGCEEKLLLVGKFGFATVWVGPDKFSLGL